MAIEADDLLEAGRIFQSALNDVLNRTLTQRRLIVTQFEASDGEPLIRVSHRQGGLPRSIPLTTEHGEMLLDLSQECGVRDSDTGKRLYTKAYRYTLTWPGAPDPWIRWEYVRQRPQPAPNKWCRHHIQGPQRIEMGVDDVGAPTFDLNRLHVPTGWVPVEDVIRFCIIDLNVPFLDAAWDDLLVESYQRFKNDFVPPPGER